MVAILFICGTILTLATLALVTRHLPKRRNFTGNHIPTATGITFLPIILTTLLVLFSGWGAVAWDAGVVSFVVYAALCGVVGFVDDVWGDAGARGFRGHFGALMRGRVTTGLVKVTVLGGGALLVGVYEFGVGWEALVGAVILAGSANLANLLDLRPGRALKFVGVPVFGLMYVAPGGAMLAVAGIVGGAVGVFYFDARGRIMLGDAGAAILGGVLGYLILAHGPGTLWWVSLAVILGLTAVAEFFSFSKIIEEVAFLRRFDAWGRGRNE